MSGVSRLPSTVVRLLVTALISGAAAEALLSQETGSAASAKPVGKARPMPSSAGGYLGVDLADVDSDLAKRLRVSSRTGAVVSRVHPKSPASDEGMEPGDVILEFGGQSTPRAAVLESVLSQCSPGKRYVVELVRGRAYMSLLVTLKALPEKPGGQDGEANQQIHRMDSRHGAEGVTGSVEQPIVRMTTLDTVLPAIGMRVTSAGTEEARDLGIETPIGAVVTAVQPASPGADAGLQRGDLITHVADREIVCYEDFESLLLGEEPGRRLSVRIARGDKQFPAEMPLGQREGQVQLYTHPSGAYQLRLPVSWSDLTGEQSSEQSVDRFQSWEGHYVLECPSGTRPAPHAEEALDAFVGRSLRQGWTNPQHVRVGNSPVAFVSREFPGEPRRLAYRIALVRNGVLCEFQLSAPIVSDTETLPVVFQQLMAQP